MPNDNDDKNLKIHTSADLSGAEAVEQQPDIEKAHELESAKTIRRDAPAVAGRDASATPNKAALDETRTQTMESSAVAPAANERTSEFSPQSAQIEMPAINLPQPDNLGAVADKVRGALERNQQMTGAFFERTLELVEEQTRQLTALDRRLGELAGQLKGLKNR